MRKQISVNEMLLNEQMGHLQVMIEQMERKIKAQEKPAITSGHIDNKRLTINYALLNGEVSPYVINPATGKRNDTPIAWYYGTNTYKIWLSTKTEHGTFCECPVGKFNKEGNRDCKHQRMLREHLNTRAIRDKVM